MFNLQMVKFSIVILASIIAAARGGTVHKMMNLNNLKFRRGDPGTEALLKKVRPYFAGPRRLQEEVAFDGSYNLKFSRCVDVKTYDELLFDGEDIIEDVKAGDVVAVKSYVLFHVCQSATCDYDAEDDLYVIDLPTYLKGVAQYHANKRNDYCTECEMFADTCNPASEEEEEEVADEDGEDGAADAQEQAAEGEQQGQEGQDDMEQAEDGQQEAQVEDGQEEGQAEGDAGEGRELKQAIDCAQCSTYECFVNEDDLDESIQSREELDDSVSEWIGELAACKASGVQSEAGMNLYMSAMCTPYGDGVELAVFLDDACTLYIATESFNDVWDPKNDNENGINYLTYAEEFIKSAFSEVTPCLQQEYVDPNDAADEEDAEEEYQMNDYCKAVLEGGAADFNNCEADVEAQEETDDEFNWYKYDLMAADDVSEVCAVINQKEGMYAYSYNSESSGTWYQRDENGAIISKGSKGSSSQFNFTFTPAIIGGIVGGCIVLIGGIAFLLRPKKAVPTEGSVYQGGVML